MTIKVGDRLPDAVFQTMTADGQQQLATETVFSGRRVVLFAVPGAFTPTCSMNHLPGYLNSLDALRERGADTVACTSVNDVHVMSAWAKQTGAEGRILMLADGSAVFAKAVGLTVDLEKAGLGLRSKRYSMIVDDGVVKTLNVEDKSGVNVSGAETALEQLGALSPA